MSHRVPAEPIEAEKLMGLATDAGAGAEPTAVDPTEFFGEGISGDRQAEI